MGIEVKKATPDQTEGGGGGGRYIIPNLESQSEDTNSNEAQEPEDDSDNEPKA